MVEEEEELPPGVAERLRAAERREVALQERLRQFQEREARQFRTANGSAQAGADGGSPLKKAHGARAGERKTERPDLWGAVCSSC